LDGPRFDALTRAAASAPSRRSLLGAALGGAVTIMLGGRAGAAVKRSTGDICRKNGDCAVGMCGPADATGRRRCGCVDGNSCGIGLVCVDGQCIGNGACTVGGNCTTVTTFGCGDNACGMGTQYTVCVTDTEGANACVGQYTCDLVTACTASVDCPNGYVCMPGTCCHGKSSVCLPVCTGTAAINSMDVRIQSVDGPLPFGG
jgi:hypothetical protein